MDDGGACRYRFLNEGVSSVVFAFTDDAGTGMVVRVPKVPYRDPRDDDRARQRICAVFSALLGSDYVSREELVMIPGVTLRAMLDAARSRRSRRFVALFDSDAVDAGASWAAWTMPDLTRVHAQSSEGQFAVELKPKWGFLPDGPGRVASVSQYCPLDMFNDDAAARTRALHCMFRTPQNHVVLFDSAGRMVDAESHALSVDDLADLIGSVLTANRDLLARIQSAQLLTGLTMRQVEHVAAKLSAEQWAAFQDEPLTDDLVQRISRAHQQSTRMKNFRCLRSPAGYASHVKTVDDTVLLEMTARDVSIMVSFVPAAVATDQAPNGIRGPPVRSVDACGRTWLYKIGVIDLETKYPKPSTTRSRLDDAQYTQTGQLASPGGY
ncbi:unnamed protein product (mitochondrion) [Plasmodiophora brassicae]|uniref:Inositol-pentakisphosphate 2-kinase n=1 Tax=Plasmodiophora brassicae TaxID=37360 RepID=A0A3P3Y162_PLABS|nr:unnamed protein product [Plasmodiophora brassicae]